MSYTKLFERYASIPPVSKERYVHDRLLYSPRRYVMRRIYTQWTLPHYFRKHRELAEQTAENTVVSLTSFPKRFSTLWLVIESLKHQTIKPEKIVLYLSNQEVKGREEIPSSLLEEEDDLFEIRFKDGKLRAHGKYHFAMLDFPDKNIVTVDDDVVYAPTMLQALLEGHRIFPKEVITNCTYQIQLNTDGSVKTYNDWKTIAVTDYRTGYCTLDYLLPMGVGGVLYPPSVLYKDALDFELAKELSYLADDLWLYAQVVLAGRRVIKTSFDVAQNIPVYIKENITLTKVNVVENQNDVQMSQLREYYLRTLDLDIVDFK